MEQGRLRRAIPTLWAALLVLLLAACAGDGGPATTAPGGPTAAPTAATVAVPRTAQAAGTPGAAGTTTRAATAATATRTTPPAGAPGTATRTAAGSPAAGPRASATAPVTTYPLTITDDAGRTVTLRTRPQKIVSLAPSNTEILYAVGLGQRTVGVDANSNYPEDAKTKPAVGGFAGTNIEQVVVLDPDLVLASGITSRDTIAALERQGQTVVVLNPKDLPGVLQNISLVGQLADVNVAAGQTRAQLEARLAAVTDRLRGVTSRPRVFFELDPTSFYTVGPNSFIDDLITRAGGANIASDAQTPFPQLSAEQIIAKDPEVIVLSDEGQGVTPQSVAARPGWAGISAVRNNRVVAINPDLTNRPGPRVFDALEQLARVLHPEAFR